MGAGTRMCYVCGAWAVLGAGCARVTGVGGADWDTVISAQQLPSVGSTVSEAPAIIPEGCAVEDTSSAAGIVVPPVTGLHEAAEGRRNSQLAGASTVPRQASSLVTDEDTRIAKKGSNFGLPIALHLTALMRGGIGLLRVRDCPAPSPSLTVCWHATLAVSGSWLRRSLRAGWQPMRYTRAHTYATVLTIRSHTTSCVYVCVCVCVRVCVCARAEGWLHRFLAGRSSRPVPHHRPQHRDRSQARLSPQPYIHQ